MTFQESWRDEFDELFSPDGDTINAILDYRGIYDCGKCFKEDEEKHYLKPIRAFIERLLIQAREEDYKKQAVKETEYDLGKKEGRKEESLRCEKRCKDAVRDTLDEIIDKSIKEGWSMEDVHWYIRRFKDENI